LEVLLTPPSLLRHYTLLPAEASLWFDPAQQTVTAEKSWAFARLASQQLLYCIAPTQPG
jgi:hypothetical protein